MSGNVKLIRFQEGMSLSAGNINYMTLKAAQALKQLKDLKTIGQ